MKVFILKEGKEYNQGVAYLDDGTMVVVDNARRMISKTIDVVVTSVLQTTAGKMIFGRYLDPTQASPNAPHGDDRPRSRSHVTPASSPGVAPAVLGGPTPAAGVAAPAAAPVAVPEPAPRAATPAAGK
jgi:hypothetical protein